VTSLPGPIVTGLLLSYDVQIGPLSFAPCLKQLFVPPCTDSSTRPHIQVSDVLETCKLNFWYYYFPFSVYVFM